MTTAMSWLTGMSVLRPETTVRTGGIPEIAKQRKSEIPVWFKGQQVGVLHNPSFSPSTREVMVVSGATNDNGNLIAHVIRMDSNRRNCRIEDRDLERLTISFEQFLDLQGIPRDATQIQRPEDMSVVFTWDVAELRSVEDQEKLFDLDCFVPV